MVPHSTIMLSLWSPGLNIVPDFRLAGGTARKAVSFFCFSDLLLGKEISVLLVGVSLKNSLGSWNGRGGGGSGQKNAGKPFHSTKSKAVLDTSIRGENMSGTWKKPHLRWTYLLHCMWLTLLSPWSINYGHRNHELIATRPVKPHLQICRWCFSPRLVQEASKNFDTKLTWNPVCMFYTCVYRVVPGVVFFSSMGTVLYKYYA